jgi:hypothetical protein
MNEEEFDSSMESRPFGTADVAKAEFHLRRTIALGMALWGRTSQGLERQLLAPHPEIPPGFQLGDFRNLQQNLQMISAALTDPRSSWLSRSILSASVISVGTQTFNTLEAKLEIVRRAIEYLDRR